MTQPLPTGSGFCIQCQTTHTLPTEPAKTAAMALMEELERKRRLDFHLPRRHAEPGLSTDYLFGPARGKMFGTLVCQSRDGSLVTLKSFSGQYNGHWTIEGWAPPLFDLGQWHTVNDGTEREIKQMGAAMRDFGSETPRGMKLMKKRQEMSRNLMKALHRLYVLHNFRGQCQSLARTYSGRNGIPNGTADCCGPKLLNFAAANELRPMGLAEFYFGRENKRGNRLHGHFYPPCREKCEPILGYLLCGAGSR